MALNRFYLPQTPKLISPASLGGTPDQICSLLDASPGLRVSYPVCPKLNSLLFQCLGQNGLRIVFDSCLSFSSHIQFLRKSCGLDLQVTPELLSHSVTMLNKFLSSLPGALTECFSIHWPERSLKMRVSLFPNA